MFLLLNDKQLSFCFFSLDTRSDIVLNSKFNQANVISFIDSVFDINFIILWEEHALIRNSISSPNIYFGAAYPKKLIYLENKILLFA